MNDHELTILVPCWGEHHTDMLKRIPLRSLMQSGNLPACGLRRIYVDGFTKPGEEARLSEAIRSELGSLPIEIQVDPIPQGLDKWKHDLHPLLNIIDRVLQRGTKMLAVMPDIGFGNGSIGNLFRYARGKNVCVSAPHLRVLPDCPIQWPMTNAELLRLAMKHPHQSQREAWVNKSRNGHMGGISLTPLTDRLTAMVHHLPTPFLSTMSVSDRDFFRQAPDMGSFDHRWPSLLMMEGRYRVIGSSELFFAVEITEAHNNHVEMKDDALNSEIYREYELHHTVNEFFVIGLQT
ncbi:MAG TPA: hypothetical protein VF077_13170 [Nitrospiraceae bacterium]